MTEANKKILIEWCGRAWTLGELADRHGLDYNILWQRLMLAKWPLEKALTEPVSTRLTVTPAERLEAMRIIKHVRKAMRMSKKACCDLFKIQPAYVSFAASGQKKPTGKPACPAWVIRQIIEIAAQEGIKPPLESEAA